MKAKLLVGLSGLTRYWDVGETVEGEEAIRLCAKGYAVPLKEERETAEKPVSLETATTRTRKPKATN